nr:YncE family protein [Mycolicibacterium chubuense]
MLLFAAFRPSEKLRSPGSTPQTSATASQVATATSSTAASTTGPTVVATIGVGAAPVGVAVSPDGKRLYVTNDVSSGTVSVIDPASGTLVGNPISVGAYPTGLAVSPDGKRVYVANANGGTVSVLDTLSGTTVGAPIPVTDPYGVAVSPDGTRVYVTNGGSGTVTVLNAASLTAVGAPITVGSRADNLALSPDGKRLYVVSGTSSGTVSVIDTASGMLVGAPIAVGSVPTHVAVSPDGTRAYVVNTYDGTVTEIDTVSGTTVGAPIAVGGYPLGLSVSPDGTQVYVANYGSNVLSVIDTVSGTTTAPIQVGSGPENVVFSPDGTRAYVTNAGSNTVSMIDTGGTGGGTGGTDVAHLPLNIYDGAHGEVPEIDVSVGGKAAIPVTVDTGSRGLVVPKQDVPAAAFWRASLNPANHVSGAYGDDGGAHYIGVLVPTAVTLGDEATGQVVTGQTQVVAVTAVYTLKDTWWSQNFPAFFQKQKKYYTSLHAFYVLTAGPSQGILGIGPDAYGGGPVVTAELPGTLGDGEFISVNGDSSYIAFGNAADLGVGGASTAGAPITAKDSPVFVQIGDGPLQNATAIFDSGGLSGYIASSLVPDSVHLDGGYLPDGTLVSVYNTQGDLLYHYTTGPKEPLSVVSNAVNDTQMNTGIMPFEAATDGNLVGLYIGNSPAGGTIVTPTPVVPKY